MNIWSYPKYNPWFVILCVLVVTFFTELICAYDLPSGLDASSLPRVSGRIESNELWIIYNIPPRQHQVILEDFHFMTVDAESVPGIVFGETRYPPGERDDEGNTIYHGIVILKKDISFSDTSASLPDSILIEAGYQFCTEAGACLAPESIQFKIVFKDALKNFNQAAEKNGLPISASVIFFNLFLAFLGGLILNVMPCVLPVLSIKLIGIVKSAHDNREEIFQGAMAYTGGVVLSFLILGAVVAGMKIAGQSVGWGFQFQNIRFVVLLLTLVWVFGLSLFDVFIIQLPGSHAVTRASRKGGHWGSFVTGIFAVLLATPCTAPLLGAALGWTFTQTPWMIILSFLFIGFGLASPFILIGLFPVFSKVIPRPGPWMNTFKVVMAFLLMATVVYLLRVVYFLVDGKVIQILWFLLFTAFACWILGMYAVPYRPRKIRLGAIIVALIIAVTAGIYFLRFEKPPVFTKTQVKESRIVRDPHHPNWYVFQPALLEEFRAEKKPVFIDFAAEWCLTCKTNEAAVLFTQDIQKAFSEKDVQLLRGDYTRKNPMLQEWLEKFDRAGVPLYVFYLPNQPDPVVLPEVITKDMILQQLKKINRDIDHS
ncbi:thioredoxin family protein [bacterium]|nr:thioredoxin family protein [bacterium]